MMSNNGAPVNTGDFQSVNGCGSQDCTKMINSVSTASQENHEILRCFVCDSKVQGRRYSLATCRTQSSRARIIEKLGELVGERYVVVISEDDVICRSCANLMNTLDHLESEMKGVKATVIRFLERKYSLTEGELLDSGNTARPCQPPQIMKSDSNGKDYHLRKRGSVSADIASVPSKKGKKSVWMQCDKCRYTTHYDTFMVHHIRQHMKKRNIHCDKCGIEFPGSKSKHWCKDGKHGHHSVEPENIERNISGKETATIQTVPVETINLLPTVDAADNGLAFPILTLQPNAETSVTVKKEPMQLINLENPDSHEFQNILANDGSLRVAQPMLMQVLQQLGVGVNFGQTDDPSTNNDAGVAVKQIDNSGKQILTLAPDGSLAMIPVDCWDNINSQDPEPDITF